MQNLNTENWREEFEKFYRLPPTMISEPQRENIFKSFISQLLQAQAREIIEEIPNGVIDADWPEHSLSSIKNQLKSRYLREGEGEV